MSYDPATGLVTRPPDQDINARVALLARLGLTAAEDGAWGGGELDAFASELASATGEAYAMVNLVTDHQYFIGLHNPQGVDLPPAGRTMLLEDGYCPDVVARRRALPLPDVCAAPRFAGNLVFDVLGIRTYTGAPLIHQESGLVIGTLCVVGPEARPLSEARERLALVKDHCTRLMNRMGERTHW
ncbi:GAF domain-containing protein [Streptomyces sp. TE33382]